MYTLSRLTSLLILLILTLVLCTSPATAHHLNESSDISNTDELAEFLDQEIQTQLTERNIPGATLSVVHNGETIYTQGYGYADIEEQREVDPATTMFEVGSVTKPVTATTVMHQVEKGNLDLDTDINTYLKDTPIEIPSTYDEPITIRHLLTHSAGFEDTYLGLYHYDKDNFKSFKDTLLESQPKRVRPPGEATAYSNWGLSLAGYIASQRANTSYIELVEESVMNPLEMDNSTFRQPVPPSKQSNLAKPYVYHDGEYRERPFGYIALRGAGPLRASAVDMAKFMEMHLGNGTRDGVGILRPETVDEMHRQQFTNHPGLRGLGLIWMERNHGEPRVITHSGMTETFYTRMALIPSTGTGLFVSYNSAGGSSAGSNLVSTFLDHYYPNATVSYEVPEPTMDSMTRNKEVEGWYRSTRSPYTGWTKLASAFLSMKVETNQRGGITTSSPAPPPFGMSTRRWIEKEPRRYISESGNNQLVFPADETGDIEYMFMDSIPAWGYEPLESHENPVLHLTAFLSTLLLFISSSLTWGYRVATKRTEINPEDEQWLTTANLLHTATTLSLIWLLSGFTLLALNPVDVYAQGSTWFELSLNAPIIITLVSPGLVASTALYIHQGENTKWKSTQLAMLSIAGLVLVALFYYWGFLPP